MDGSGLCAPRECRVEYTRRWLLHPSSAPPSAGTGLSSLPVRGWPRPAKPLQHKRSPNKRLIGFKINVLPTDAILMWPCLSSKGLPTWFWKQVSLTGEGFAFNLRNGCHLQAILLFNYFCYEQLCFRWYLSPEKASLPKDSKAAAGGRVSHQVKEDKRFRPNILNYKKQLTQSRRNRRQCLCLEADVWAVYS